LRSFGARGDTLLHVFWLAQGIPEAVRPRLARDTARAANTGEVKELLRQPSALKEVVADLTLENRLLKKHGRGWEERGMRNPAPEKAEIIQLVEQSHMPAKRTLDTLGMPRTSFYLWFHRYRAGGPELLLTAGRGLIKHGTAFPMTSAGRLLIWR